MRRLATILLLVASACWAPRPANSPGYFDAKTWGNAFAVQLERPDQLALASTALAATLVLPEYDRRLNRESADDQPLTEGSTANGDGVAIGLGVLATGLGGANWIGGDGGRDAQVLLQSFVLVDGVTEALKHTTRRRRPDDSAQDSFPSGHTSFAFCMATFVQRSIARDHDGAAEVLSYLAYVPALYVGIDRSEASRHWPTDIAFGAFLGITLTNVVFDASYGEPGRPGLFGVNGLSVEPEIGSGSSGLSLVLRF
ncbi:MAG: phosphatase PAP2 family protein [Planctomycetota bacterium]